MRGATLLWLALLAAAAPATAGPAVGKGPPPGGFADAPSCNPLVCKCSSTTRKDGGKGDEAETLVAANCSSRGFLSLPTGLPADLNLLDLSDNDLSGDGGGGNASSTASAEALLAGLPALVSLYLSGNRLQSLRASGGRLVHYSLETLDLSENNVSSVRALGLTGLVSLRKLDLSSNRLVSLPPGALAGSPLLRSLDLSSNGLLTLEPGSLDNLTALEELVLSRNRLSSIPKGLFRNLRGLRHLDLDRNRFVEVQGLSFHGLESLRTLRLRRNAIEYLMDGAFFGLKAIRDLKLDGNRVNAVTKGWLYGLRTLERLSLAGNAVEYVADDAWEFCESLHTLDLSGNRLQLLDRDSLRRLPRLARVRLEDNIISHVQDDGGGAFAETPLLEELVLDGNLLSHTVEDTAGPFAGLGRLRLLSLDRNQVKSLGSGALDGLGALEELKLSGNVISTVQEGAFDHSPLLRTVRLDSTSLLCDCHLGWLTRWTNRTGATGAEEASCAHPEALKGRRVLSLSDEVFTCDDFPKPYILHQPETRMALKGSDLVLSCRAASTSPAEMDFEWKVDSDVVAYPACTSSSGRRCVKSEAHSFDGKGREVTSELRLSNVTHADAGRYQCVVSNRFGATYSDRAEVTVYVFPAFLVVPEDITVEGGATAALSCAARGAPAPKVSWSKLDSGGGFPAAEERRIAVSSRSDTADPLAAFNSFVIYAVSARDMGVYQCLASNPAGSVSWNITLSVLEAPRFAKPMEGKSVAPGETAVIECLSSGSPRPRLAWTKDGSPLEPTERHFFTADNQLLIIVKAEHDDQGRYECTMHNQLGTETQSAYLTVPGHTGTGATSSNDVPGGDDDDGGFVSDKDSTRDKTIGIVVVALVVCVLATSLVWLAFIYRARRRRSRQRRQDGEGESNPQQYEEHRRWRGHLRPSPSPPPSMCLSSRPGEGEFDIHEHVRRGLLGSGKMSGNGPPASLDVTKGLLNTDLSRDEEEERDSGTGDSKRSCFTTSADHGHTDEDCYAGSSVYDGGNVGGVLGGEADDEEEDEEGALLAADGQAGAGEARISLSEFEALPGGGGAGIPFADDEDDGQPDSTISSSAAAAGAEEGGGEGRLSSSGGDCHYYPPSSSSGATAVSHLNGSSRQVAAPDVQFRTFGRAPSASCYALNGFAGGRVGKSGRKRASTVELNGECYLQLEGPDPTAAAVTPAPADPVEYRGGVGSLPRGRRDRGLRLQQEVLEASLNSTSSEYRMDEEGSSRRPGRKEEKRRSFRRSTSMGGVCNGDGGGGGRRRRSASSRGNGGRTRGEKR